MGFDKFERQLKLMYMLTQNRSSSLEEITKQLGLSSRSAYRYLEFFRENGFKVIKEHGIFRLDKESEYFRKITELIHFTEEEAMTLKMILEGIPQKTLAIKHLLEKLSRIYDLELLEQITSNEQFAQNYRTLYQAIKEGRQCLLQNYLSSNSGTVKDRLVEPFAFLASNTEIRAFETDSRTNKTFKISRIEKVVLLDTQWDFRPFHKKLYTDAFHFSAEVLIPVKLRLDLMAKNLLTEEFIIPKEELTPLDDKHWIYSTQVCRFEGIGRFVMGLLGHVEVLENQELKAYIKDQLKKGLDTIS